MSLFTTALVTLGAFFNLGIAWLYIKTQRTWYRNDFGKIIVTLSLCEGIFFSWYILVILWPEIPGRNIVRNILFASLVLVTGYRFFTMLRLNRIIKRDKEIRNEA